MRKTVLLTMIVLVLSAIVLTACGGASDGPVIGDAANGEALYNRATLGKKSSAGCVSCHNFDASKGDESGAPYTAGTATRAESRVPGFSSEEYIQESILNPDAYVVDGFVAGVMYQSWGEDLNEQEIADLVAYILTEK